MSPKVSCVIVVLATALAGCGQPGAELDAAPRADAFAVDATAFDTGLDAPPRGDADTADASTGLDSGGDTGALASDSGIDASGVPDAGGSDAGTRVIGVRVLADAACSDLSFDPPSISVPAGSTFTVNWINATGCTEVDIDKNGDVPIVIGLPPGGSYHDTVREWCGAFTGTFFFRAYYSPSFPYYLDVDCSG